MCLCQRFIQCTMVFRSFLPSPINNVHNDKSPTQWSPLRSRIEYCTVREVTLRGVCTTIRRSACVCWKEDINITRWYAYLFAFFGYLSSVKLTFPRPHEVPSTAGSERVYLHWPLASSQHKCSHCLGPIYKGKGIRYKHWIVYRRVIKIVRMCHNYL